MTTKTTTKTPDQTQAPKLERPKMEILAAARASSAVTTKTPKTAVVSWGERPTPNSAYAAGGRHGAKRVSAGAMEMAKKHATETGCVLVLPSGEGSGAGGPNAHHAIVVVGPKGAWGVAHGGGAVRSAVRWALVHAEAYKLPVVGVSDAARTEIAEARGQ